MKQLVTPIRLPGRSRSAAERPSRAFTLVELLVVIAIVGVLAALLIPAIQSARESSRRAACQNNLKQIGVALANYEAAMNRWPPGKKWSGPTTDPSSFAMSWSSFVLNYLEEQVLAQQIDYKLPFTDPKNMPATSTVVPVYLCPSTSDVEEHRVNNRLQNLGSIAGEGLACIDYLGISGPDKDAKHPVTKVAYGRQRGVLIGTKGLPLEEELIEPPPITSAKISDGLSMTICISECTGRGMSVKDGVLDSPHGAWASGSNVTHIDGGINDHATPKVWYEEQIHADHPGGAHVLKCDGSVHFLYEEVEKKVVRSLATRDGGEAVPDNVF
jgi:prepilin-type N-terminal cleavage/methylation domain-containing protein/prepilin-type processing-associated H-X9-DG protein